MPRSSKATARGEGVAVVAVPSKPEKIRVQYTMSADTVRRVRVHCSLEDLSESEFVEEALLRYLREFGEGRELFDPSPPHYAWKDGR
jgi:hypothetical protein